MPSPKLRVKRAARDTSMPTLTAVYIDHPGDGHEVHREYVRRWREWHDEQCGRRDCIHADPHGIVQRLEAQP